MIKEIGILMVALSVTCSPLLVGADIYEYDILNRLTKVIYEDGSYVEYEYDANGNIINTYVYDASPEEDDTGEEEPDDSGGETEENGEIPTESEEETEEIPEDEEEPVEEEETIVTQIVSAIQKIFTGFMNWFKSLF